jgi:nucleotide-binding universal stress UspA family protein
MLRSILVPMDVSTFGEKALPVAATIAARAKAHLHLLHVHRPLAEVHPEFAPYFDDQKLAVEIKTRQREYLDKLAARLTEKYGVEVLCVLKDGPTAATIEDYTKTHAIDLVVMTTHARGALARFWLGSVADALVRHLSVPMLLVRPDGHEHEQPAEPAVRRMLIALDGSPFSEQVLKPAVELCQVLDAECLLYRVIKPFVPANYTLEGVGHLAAGLVDQLESMQKRAVEEANTYLERIANQCRARKLKASPEVVVADEPATSILEKGKPPAIDVIALATHGRRGLSRLMLGSTADKVVRGSNVPVLVYRPKD